MATQTKKGSRRPGLNALTEKQIQEITEFGKVTYKGKDDKNKSIFLNEKGEELSRNKTKKLIKDWWFHTVVAFGLKEKRKLNRKRKREERKKRNAEDERPRKKMLKGKNLKKHIRNLLEKESCPSVVIDCSFDSYMDEPTIKSLATQISRCIGENNKAPNPLKICLSGLEPDGKLKKQLNKIANGQIENWVCEIEETHFMNKYSKQNLVYLTAEADESIDQIETDKVYVIGGIIDHNSHPGLCNGIAKKHELTTEKLPIAKHMNFPETGGRVVITVNQVFDMILGEYNWKSWRKALRFAIPERKHFVLKTPLTEKEKESLGFFGHELTSAKKIVASTAEKKVIDKVEKEAKKHINELFFDNHMAYHIDNLPELDDGREAKCTHNYGEKILPILDDFKKEQN